MTEYFYISVPHLKSLSIILFEFPIFFNKFKNKFNFPGILINQQFFPCQYTIFFFFNRNCSYIGSGLGFGRCCGITKKVEI